MNKDLERYDIEKLGEVYATQAEHGVIVVPKGTEVEELIETDCIGHAVLIVDEEHEQILYEDEEDKE